jgi:monothiol glutaredoxin
MALSDAMRTRLEGLVKSKDVVLFMKGSRHFPQCGFSATVVGILDKVGVTELETVNVLADPAVREGIKELSSWPTIPQLYVKGELVGGCDIVKEMFASGELHKLLGKSPGASAGAADVKPPTITILDGAARAFRDAAAQAEGDVLRLEIDAQFQNDLYFAPAAAGDIAVTSNGIAVHVDAATAARASGVTIDFVTDAKGGAGFKIDNPNEPPRVKSLTVAETKALLDAGKLELFDVRPEAERSLALIAAAHALDEAGQKRLMALPRHAPIGFHCHHGVRSRRTAEQLLREGFTSVYNVEGGIDAWSQDVDPAIPRY